MIGAASGSSGPFASPEDRSYLSFAYGVPDPALCPWDDIHDVVRELLDSRSAKALHYGPMGGDPALLDSIRHIVDARGIAVESDSILVTTGSQQALNLVARVLVRPGDVVLVPRLTYPGAIGAFRQASAEIVAIALDDTGIDLDDAERTWQRLSRAGRPPKLIYVIPTCDNPTGVTMPSQKRRQMLHWARSRNAVIVEDDPYYALGANIVEEPIRAMDDGQGVIYISTFSKILAPALRIGWIVGPPSIVQQCETVKVATDLTTSMLSQLIVDSLIRRGVLLPLASVARAAYRRKRDVLVEMLSMHLRNALHWSPPQGGFYLWAYMRLGWDGTHLQESARQHGVEILDGKMFRADGIVGGGFRLAYSALSEDMIRDGVSRLARAFERTR